MSNNRYGAPNIEQAPRERAILALAGRQSGYLSRAQLLDLGLSDTAIRHRITLGRYVKQHHGVYGIAPPRTDLPGLAWAAVLACGLRAVASHLTAAVLWEMLRHHRLPIHITAPSGHAREGIITHRSVTLSRTDQTHQRGVPVTSRARTLLDIAPLLPVRQVRRIVNDHARAGALRLPALHDVLDRNSRHPGVAVLRPIVDDTRHGLTRSELEDAFLAFVKRYELPMPRVDTVVDGVEVDAYFPQHDLIIELDTTDFHGDRLAFETDRERDAIHLSHGRPTLRITGERIDLTPAAEAERLRRILALRTARPDGQP